MKSLASKSFWIGRISKSIYQYFTYNDLTKIIYKPAGYLLAPIGEERTGDVSNVVFSNGWIADDNGVVFIYYASSDTRIHVASSTVDRLLDYVMNTPPDGFSSAETVRTLNRIIENNQSELMLNDTLSSTVINKTR